MITIVSAYLGPLFKGTFNISYILLLLHRIAGQSLPKIPN